MFHVTDVISILVHMHVVSSLGEVAGLERSHQSGPDNDSLLFVLRHVVWLLSRSAGGKRVVSTGGSTCPTLSLKPKTHYSTFSIRETNWQSEGLGNQTTQHFICINDSRTSIIVHFYLALTVNSQPVSVAADLITKFPVFRIIRIMLNMNDSYPDAASWDRAMRRLEL